MKCGLLGRKLSHSYSPQIHSFLGDYSYELHEKEPDELEAFLRDTDLTGFNVTIPYKKDVIPFLDHIDPIAEKLGAVNTIVRKPDGTLWGYNTDHFGFHSMVARSRICVEGKKVLVLGSGGASVTVCQVIRELGGDPIVISRSGESNYQNLQRHKDAAVIVNTTPVGMYPNAGVSPVELDLFPQLEGVLDLIYNPRLTQLLLDARDRNIPCENGLWMLVAQAKRAAEIFTGTALPDEKIRAIHSALQKQMMNIVLVGMPGCGKTTVAAELSQRTGRHAVDSDQRIRELAGKSIPEIFALEGEAAFRDLETQALSEYGKSSGLIIATGGGSVTKERNYPLLHQNGMIIWLRRSIESLPTDGRPLSQGQDLAQMYRKREPMYQAFADFTVDNDGSVTETVARIMACLEEEI